MTSQCFMFRVITTFCVMCVTLSWTYCIIIRTWCSSLCQDDVITVPTSCWHVELFSVVKFSIALNVNTQQTFDPASHRGDRLLPDFRFQCHRSIKFFWCLFVQRHVGEGIYLDRDEAGRCRADDEMMRSWAAFQERSRNASARFVCLEFVSLWC